MSAQDTDTKTEETYEFAAPDFSGEEEEKAVDENPAEDIADDGVDDSANEPGEEADGTEEEGGEEEEEENPSEIGPDLIYQAAQIGMSLDDVKRFSTADDLLIAMNMIRSRSEGKEDKKEEQEQEWYDLDFGEDEVDEELVKPIAGLNDFMKEQITALKNEITELRQAQLEREHMEYEQRFEDNVNSLGDEWKDVFGKGTIDDISEVALENRKRLFMAVDRIREIDAAKNVVRPMSKIVKDALLYEFKDKMKDGERRKILAQANKRTKTHKPNRKQKSFANDDEEAINFIRDNLREMGVKEPEFVPFK